MDILNILLYIFVAFLIMYSVLILKGPSIWDRLLAMNLMSAKVIIFVAVLATLTDLSFYLDIAILYLLGGFMGTIFICLFIVDKANKGIIINPGEEENNADSNNNK